MDLRPSIVWITCIRLEISPFGVLHLQYWKLLILNTMFCCIVKLNINSVNLRVHFGQGCCLWVSACGSWVVASSSESQMLGNQGGCRDGQACGVRLYQSPPIRNCGTCSGSRRRERCQPEGCTWRGGLNLPDQPSGWGTCVCKLQKQLFRNTLILQIIFLV